jgi:Gpi18-like mannosyltransferase
MKNKISIKNKNEYTDIIILCLCVTAVLFIAWIFTGQWPWEGQPYNSYILQAQSWLKGRLDLGQDYPYLELAIYNNKYFVSFPPFPSYVMLPFVALGWNTCDSMIAFVASLAGAVYAFKIMKHFNVENKKAIFFALFLTVGSNWLMTAQNAWVWFIAQNMAFTLSLMAIYYALKNKAGLSLAFWACAVGCRPFQALYIPVLLYLLYKAHKEQNHDDKLIDIIKKRWLALIPMAIIALSYMILNFARFGNITEFGHNYLP